MDKEFCTYSQALRLKALGLDKHCFGFWSKIHGLFITNAQGKLNKNAGECLAPTFSQAFLFVMQFPQIKRYRYNIALYSDGTYSIKEGKDSIHEYLSAKDCLDKLLEIVESKSE